MANDQSQDQEFDSAGSVKILKEDLKEQIKTTDKALTDGIQDITNTLTGEYSINQIMQMILEIIYRALPGSRVVLCLKDGKANCIRARFGFGEDVDRIVSHFSIPLSYQGDVFHISFKNNVDIHIENTRDEKIKQKNSAVVLPEYRSQKLYYISYHHQSFAYSYDLYRQRSRCHHFGYR